MIIKIYKEYSDEYYLEFNSTKSNIVVFSRNRNIRNIRNIKIKVKTKCQELMVTNTCCHL